MAEAHLLLGSNLGDRLKNLEKARDYLSKYVGTLKGVSQVFITQPWGFECQDMFYNQAVLIDTEYFPKELLLKLKNIEILMGRIKPRKDSYASRIIDIDIIFYEARTGGSPSEDDRAPFCARAFVATFSSQETSLTQENIEGVAGRMRR